LKAADGRDLSKEEWRTIPGFSSYKITKDGDVKHRWTGRLVKELQNINTGAWSYHLYRDDGGHTARNFQTLIYLAYPELKPEEKWRTHPRFDWVEVSKAGEVRNKRTRHVFIPKSTKALPTPHIRLRENGQKHDIPVTQLVAETYQEAEEAA
jgi:hypothetical protein